MRSGICKKGKVHPYSAREHRQVLISFESVGGEALMSVRGSQCSTRPTVIFPRHKASLLVGWYQIILLDDKQMCVNDFCTVELDDAVSGV